MKNTELKKGSAELLILSLLDRAPLHGYELCKLIETRSKGAVRFKVASQALTSTQIVLLGLTSTSGGALLNGFLANQGSSVSFTQNTSARVLSTAASGTGADDFIS